MKTSRNRAVHIWVSKGIICITFQDGFHVSGGYLFPFFSFSFQFSICLALFDRYPGIAKNPLAAENKLGPSHDTEDCERYLALRAKRKFGVTSLKGYPLGGSGKSPAHSSGLLQKPLDGVHVVLDQDTGLDGRAGNEPPHPMQAPGFVVGRGVKDPR